MKIVVLGGNGFIGTKLVAGLKGRGHEVIAASPRIGVNTVTGEGLNEALPGATAVVDVSNSPSSEDLIGGTLVFRMAQAAVMHQLGRAEAEPNAVNAIQSFASELVAGMVRGDVA